MRSAFIILALSLVLLFQQTLQSKCSAGTYERFEYHSSVCVPCPRGYFCPGDGLSYLCSSSSYAPSPSMVECIPCPKATPRSCPGSPTFCLPADAPANIEYFEYQQDLRFTYPLKLSKTSHFVTEIVFQPQIEVAALSLYHSQYNQKFILYASTTTGNPSENNHEFQTDSANCTLAFKQSEAKNLFLPVFITILSEAKDEIKYGSAATRGKVITSMESSTFLQDNNSLLYKYLLYAIPSPATPSKASFNITINSAARWLGADLFMSSDRTVAFPNEFNSDIRYRQISEQGKTVTLEVVLERVEPSDTPLYFSIVPSMTLSPLHIYTSVKMAPLKKRIRH